MNRDPKALADFLEKTADYVDALEAENAELRGISDEVQNAKVAATADKFASSYASITGEALDPDVARKLASSEDEDVQTVLQKFARLEPADALGSLVGTKKSGTGDAAWDAFETFLLG